MVINIFIIVCYIHIVLCNIKIFLSYHCAVYMGMSACVCVCVCVCLCVCVCVCVCAKLGFDLESVCFAWIYIFACVFTGPSNCGHICAEPCLGAHLF